MSGWREGDQGCLVGGQGIRDAGLEGRWGSEVIDWREPD
jgi:hypothetical protein